MASIRVPSNVSSITFTTSGAKTAVNGIISGITSLEATALARNGTLGMNAVRMVSTTANGSLWISVPRVVSVLVVNSVTRMVSGSYTPWGVLLSAPVPPVDASILLNEGFSLVQG